MFIFYRKIDKKFLILVEQRTIFLNSRRLKKFFNIRIIIFRVENTYKNKIFKKENSQKNCFRTNFQKNNGCRIPRVCNIYTYIDKILNVQGERTNFQKKF